jgi:hypothetical protein
MLLLILEMTQKSHHTANQALWQDFFPNKAAAAGFSCRRDRRLLGFLFQHQDIKHAAHTV